MGTSLLSALELPCETTICLEWTVAGRMCCLAWEHNGHITWAHRKSSSVVWGLQTCSFPLKQCTLHSWVKDNSPLCLDNEGGNKCLESRITTFKRKRPFLFEIISSARMSKTESRDSSTPQCCLFFFLFCFVFSFFDKALKLRQILCSWQDCTLDVKVEPCEMSVKFPIALLEEDRSENYCLSRDALGRTKTFVTGAASLDVEGSKTHYVSSDGTPHWSINKFTIATSSLAQGGILRSKATTFLGLFFCETPGFCFQATQLLNHFWYALFVERMFAFTWRGYWVHKSAESNIWLSIWREINLDGSFINSRRQQWDKILFSNLLVMPSKGGFV